MPPGSRVCPYCGALNAADERQCHRCARAMPGAVGTAGRGLLESLVATDFPVTKLLLAFSVAVFLLSALGAGNLEALWTLKAPDAVAWGALAGILPVGCLGFEQPWRYLSANFVHLGALHIAFNMWALWDFGRATEQRFGRARFLLIFVLTGVAGFVASDVWFLYLQEPLLGPLAPIASVGGPLQDLFGIRPLFYTAGASAGLFGLVGALVGYLYARRDPAYKRLLKRIALIALVLAILMPVNNAAHVGGALAGVPLGILAYREHRPGKRARIFGWVAGLLMVASIASVVLSRVAASAS